jgi:hypothetical protein
MRIARATWEVRALDASGRVLDRERLESVYRNVAINRAQVLRCRPGAVVAVVLSVSPRTGAVGAPVLSIRTADGPGEIRYAAARGKPAGAPYGTCRHCKRALTPYEGTDRCDDCHGQMERALDVLAAANGGAK